MRSKALIALWIAAAVGLCGQRAIAAVGGLGGLGGQRATAAGGGCTTAAVPGSQTLQLTVDGTQRTALMHIPPGLAPGERVPLVLVLHGYGGSGPRMERYSGFSTIADRFGFIAAYPSSMGVYWNSTATPGMARDVRFLAALIDVTEQSMCVDPQRVFATGVSNGGSMVALAGCELSSRIAAIAPVAGDYTRQPSCRPARPVSVLEVHGTADPIVPYFGGLVRKRPADGLPLFVNGWVARDRCAGVSSARPVAYRATVFAWSGCAGSTRVEHIRIAGGRHQWPGAIPPDPGPPSTFCGACVIWRFFSTVQTVRRVFPIRRNGSR